MTTILKLDSNELCTPDMLDQILDDVGVADSEDEMNADEREICKQSMIDLLTECVETVGCVHEAIAWWTEGFIKAKRLFSGTGVNTKEERA